MGKAKSVQMKDGAGKGGEVSKGRFRPGWQELGEQARFFTQRRERRDC